MQSGSFTVGDFALFVFYLEFIADLTAFSGLIGRPLPADRYIYRTYGSFNGRC